jgi:hypothetical protein
MPRPEEHDKFSVVIQVRCWNKHKLILETIAEQKGIELPDVIRSLIVKAGKELQKEKEEEQ